MQTFQTGTVQANGIRFHFLEMGDGPLALCLHSFPDSSWTYRYLLPSIAEANYRAVAPFMLGYAPTGDERPDLAVPWQEAVTVAVRWHPRADAQRRGLARTPIA